MHDGCRKLHQPLQSGMNPISGHSPVKTPAAEFSLLAKNVHIQLKHVDKVIYGQSCGHFARLCFTPLSASPSNKLMTRFVVVSIRSHIRWALGSLVAVGWIPRDHAWAQLLKSWAILFRDAASCGEDWKQPKVMEDVGRVCAKEITREAYCTSVVASRNYSPKQSWYASYPPFMT